MATYLSLHFHIIFSTKNREPWIDKLWKQRLHEYLGGTARGKNATPEQIGGIEDHVHLLLGLRATHCLADVIRELKKASSNWVHSEIGLGDFCWQEGYAAFTVSPTSRDAVKSYIANQEEHHRTRLSREELEIMLSEADVAYDPQYFA